MRIAAVSDIHVQKDGSDDQFVQKIHERVVELTPHVFVISGDISDSINAVSDTLNKLYIPDCVNLYVAGNHDIWFERDRSLGSLEKYSKGIGKVCDENGFTHLPDEPYVDGDLAFVGSIGWYDYSFRREDLEIPMESYENKEFRDALWYDVLSVDWEFSDKEATNLFNRKLEYDLENLPDEVSRVVYVSHHLPFQDLTVYKDRLPWDFFSAFIGAKSTGEILRNDGRVILSISGHSHIRNKIEVGEITAMTVPFGYGRPDEGGLEAFVKAGVADIMINGRNIVTPNFVTGDICAGLSYVLSR